MGNYGKKKEDKMNEIILITIGGILLLLVHLYWTFTYWHHFYKYHKSKGEQNEPAKKDSEQPKY